MVYFKLKYVLQIASVFYYLCVVALQYICPIIMCLYMALMYKTLGGYTWSGLFYESQEVCTMDDKTSTVTDSIVEGDGIEQFQLAWENLKMVSLNKQYLVGGQLQ